MPSPFSSLRSPSLRKQLMDLGLGHRAYTPFLIVGRSRVGSNLLRGLLNGHPGVVTYGEIFRDTRNMDWDHTGYFQSPAAATRLQEDPVRFVDTQVFGRYPRGTGAVGFKLFYYHAREGRAREVWDYLAQRRDLLVLHLKRRNILQTHLSRKRAALTDRWVNTSGQPEDNLVVTLDYEECLNDFRQTRGWEEDCDRLFGGHRKLDVLYEGLAGDYQAEAARIQAFLGLPPHAVAPSTFQQTRQPLHATIANYADLKARFAGTPWEGFFTD
jgi:LPS sulfotransferase NodH